jgi:hypothetical protein
VEPANATKEQKERTVKKQELKGETWTSGNFFRGICWEFGSAEKKDIKRD